MANPKLVDEVGVGERVALESCSCVVERVAHGDRRLVPLRRIARCEAHQNQNEFPADFEVARHVPVARAE